MTAEPQWTDSGQGDLLALVAVGNVATDTAEREWHEFTVSLAIAAGASNDGLTINPNSMRRLTRGHVAPQRIGAFTNRALAQKLIAPTGEWEVSDDRQGKNAGRPMRVYRWLGP